MEIIQKLVEKAKERQEMKKGWNKGLKNRAVGQKQCQPGSQVACRSPRILDPPLPLCMRGGMMAACMGGDLFRAGAQCMDVNARNYRWLESRSKVCQIFDKGRTR
ncbi:hypothetical protein E2C01_086513 [Portunus trituberculatus]|uniref:Uncharacterized protein n=1 Tax=Portunus trituberculatus TaxID=210409 RepID=A0A5B7JAI8_PORTR|nr:hypothetical protein [Portunus trituberculatus]